MFRGSLVSGEKFDLKSLRVFGFVESGLLFEWMEFQISL